MDTTNIILHWIAHIQGQINKTEARPRPNAQGQNFGLEALTLLPATWVAVCQLLLPYSNQKSK